LQADDILVRNRACGHLDTAMARLRDIEAAFRKRFLPPPTRAAPVPDPLRLGEARAIAELRARIATVETQLRSAAMPPKDRIWAAHRDHIQTLAQLLNADTLLVGGAHELAGCLAPEVDVSMALPDVLARCEQLRAVLERALAGRTALLAIGIAGIRQ
jgi:hypothetical protein